MARTVVSARHPSSVEVSATFAVLRMLVTNRQIRIAVISALCSMVLVGIMAGAAIMCADDACRSLPDPRAVIEVEDGRSDPAVAPGPQTGPPPTR
jgi:hypothetical protein